MAEPTDLVPLIKTKQRREAVDGIMKALGVPSAEQMAEMVDGMPNQIRDAFDEALGRNELYRRAARQRGEEEKLRTGLDPAMCCNRVCPKIVPAEVVQNEEEGWVMTRPGSVDTCADGVEGAQGCIFRLKEHPLSDPTVNYPSHNECLQMLMRAGLLEPDDFGRYNGTDFAFRGRRLWWRLVDLLVETGKISRVFVETDDPEARIDRGTEAYAATHWVLKLDPPYGFQDWLKTQEGL